MAIGNFLKNDFPKRSQLSIDREIQRQNLLETPTRWFSTCVAMFR
ncbi:hypothetical protein [Geitlerinema sp. PCC 9228]|nr:hypothetical protein [Geitlerinema sp. PCC 9228]